ncbi:tRNA A64-2'-O-ribosylphosphate transferase isoform X2 [Alnus glutinosa]|uniref:tRNA A64-2'-O-ribosylphosphate transferase isoform X2 n=1 Tax=Alnus glutinosa TaxID=3517 RepID=UPI002D77F48F|nr:tRNA A64-2'-O-ribosylphosphate transferase isoform X2 [Alnus glutinosa]
MEDDTATTSANLSIYRAARSIKRRDNTLYNALRSIYEDSVFVGEIAQLWPDLPLLANLRCGYWYSPKFHSTCYFKSTDGHTNNWSFNTSRLNLHVAHLKGGCIIVDSTRRGKRFPDSMSKTIPIWTCVLNRSIRNHLNSMRDTNRESNTSHQDDETTRQVSLDWDCSLHLPLWVSETEKAAIEDRLEEWTEQLHASGADIASLAFCLKKPLRPLWISQKTVIWLNEVPDHDSWDFTPIILVTASSSSGVIQHRSTSEFSWNYIAGAGDDEESWARGLSPNLFWKHAHDLISSGPDLCNQKVADIVEKDRVYRAHRGQNPPQVTVKAPKLLGSSVHFSKEVPLPLDISNIEIGMKSSDEECAISWLGSTNLAVGTSQPAVNVSNVDCILNCDRESISLSLSDAEAYLHLPIVTSKLDRFSLLSNLPSAVNFAKLNLSKGKTLLICCHDGEDISVCVCLAILTSLFNDGGTFDNGKSFNETCITKLEMRRRLVYICKFATNARPSRGNLRQVFGFLSGGRVSSD